MLSMIIIAIIRKHKNCINIYRILQNVISSMIIHNKGACKISARFIYLQSSFTYTCTHYSSGIPTSKIFIIVIQSWFLFEKQNTNIINRRSRCLFFFSYIYHSIYIIHTVKVAIYFCIMSPSIYIRSVFILDQAFRFEK